MPAKRRSLTAPKIPLTKSVARPAPTVLTVGRKSATREKITLLLEIMSRATCPATTISMTTVLGAMSPSMVTSGIPPTLSPTGPPTATAIGTGSIPGDGHGSVMSLGDLLLITMAAGYMLAADGAGAQDRTMVLQFMAPPSSASSAVAGASDSGLDMAGSRWDSASRSSPGSAAATISLTSSMSTTLLLTTSTSSTIETSISSTPTTCARLQPL